MKFLVMAAIVIESKINPGSALKVPDTGKTTVKVPFEVGDEWQGTLVLKDMKESKALTAEMQFQTSISISNEGPWIALTSWKHFESEWYALKRESGDEARFEIPEIRQDLSQQFPFISHAEFLAAVKKEDKKWLPLAESCKTPTTPPCSVGISKVTIRIYEGEGAARKVFRELVIEPPQGC